MVTSSYQARRGPLHDVHVALGAKFADFAGWQMPLQYRAGVLAEHTSVRERVGAFDVSHLGTIWVTGPGAAAFANTCFSADLDQIGDGRAQYTLCCNDAGGVVDDLLVYRFAADELLCVPNAANTAAVAQLLRAAAPGPVDVVDDHGAHAIIAVQGPGSARLLRDLGLAVPDAYLGFLRARSDLIGGADINVMVCRTGYTGEHGYELITDAADAVPLWTALLRTGESLGVAPCGLAARDTLRTEMGYPLHGHELTQEITPLEAGLGWAVGWNKPAFWGWDALVEQRRAGVARRSVGLMLPPGPIARAGAVVRERSGGDVIGTVTSGTFSPTLRAPIALAMVDTGGQPQMPQRDTVSVDIRGRDVVATVTTPPFVQTKCYGTPQ